MHTNAIHSTKSAPKSDAACAIRSGYYNWYLFICVSLISRNMFLRTTCAFKNTIFIIHLFLSLMQSEGKR